MSSFNFTKPVEVLGQGFDPTDQMEQLKHWFAVNGKWVMAGVGGILLIKFIKKRKEKKKIASQATQPVQ